MSTPSKSELAQRLTDGPARAKEASLSAFGNLVQVADSLGLRELANQLQRTAEDLFSDTFSLIILGRFKSGKSTLLNALLGDTTRPVELQGFKGPVTVDDLPATAKITGVRYADNPYVKAWAFDDVVETWPLARYLRESILDADEEQSLRRLGHIREFEVGFPARLCQAGVTIYDSPGLDDQDVRTVLIREAAKRCDAAIVVHRSDTLMGISELQEIQSVLADPSRTFTVINISSDRQVDDRLLGYVWNRYVRDQLGGPSWNGEDLAERDIYLVNAEQARKGRNTGDGVLVEASGLLALEDALGDFLIRDRQEVHLHRFLGLAEHACAVIEDHLIQRRRATGADRSGLREAYQAALPELAGIRAMPQRLPQLFDGYRLEAQRALTSSFGQVMMRIRHELPGRLEAARLSTARERLSTLAQRQKELQTEAAQIISAFVTSEIDRWSGTEVNAILAPLMDRLGAEIEAEITAIGSRLGAFHLDLNRTDARIGDSVEMATERVLSAVSGPIFGNTAGDVTISAGGKRGGAGWVVGTLGSTFLPGAIILPAVLAVDLFASGLGGGAGLENRVKAEALKSADELLRRLPEEAEGRIAGQLEAAFRTIQETVSEDVREFIDQEERHIRDMVEVAEVRTDHDDELIVLAEASVREQRRNLHQALTITQV